MIESYQLICHKHLVRILLRRLLNLKRNYQGPVLFLSEFLVYTNDFDFERILDGDMNILKNDIFHRDGQFRRKSECQRILIGLVFLQ